MTGSALAVLAGVIVAVAIMMGFDFANSRWFPFPADMDLYDIVQVLALAAVGVLNALMIQNPWWFHFGGLPVFLIFTDLGYRAGRVPVPEGDSVAKRISVFHDGRAQVLTPRKKVGAD
jgi:hypothetical protein